MGNCSNASIAEELSVDEDFYSCKTTISTYDFNGTYAADSEDIELALPPSVRYRSLLRFGMDGIIKRR